MRVHFIQHCKPYVTERLIYTMGAHISDALCAHMYLPPYSPRIATVESTSKPWRPSPVHSGITLGMPMR